MTAQVFMAVMVLLSGGLPGATVVDDVLDGAGDIGDDIVSAAGDALDTASKKVNSAVDQVNSYGKVIGNGLESIRESPGSGPIIGGDPTNYTEERDLANQSLDALTTTLNTHESVWVAMDTSVVQGNITENEVINVVVLTEDDVAIGANYTVRMNWSNISVENGSANLSGQVIEYEPGLANDSDLTVYPRVSDIEYATENYQDIANVDTRAEVGSELWERTTNMRCEPSAKCSHLKNLYEDNLINRVLGGLAG